MKRGAGRPTSGYYLADGTRVPSVTSITGRAKDAGGLIFAAKRNWHRAGELGLPFGRDDFWGDEERWGGANDATEAGSIVHQWIEDDLHGAPHTRFDEAPVTCIADANKGYGAYREWRELVKCDVLETEVPLVSEMFGYGGTLDALAVINGRRVILDWKTSNSSYPDYIAQIAAYRQLVNEHADIGLEPVTGAYLLRVGKEFGDFHWHSWPEGVLDIGWSWFLAAKELYDLDKRLKKVAS